MIIQLLVSKQTSNFIPMKKLILLAVIISLSISCKPKKTDDVTPTETACLVQKISYDDGTYELYKFDANKRLIETTITYEDNGKIVEIPVKYEYNSAGNLSKSTTPDGWTDNYVYDANGLLTRVDFKDEKGQVDEQFTVTMDAQKRITKVVTKKDGLTGTYEYNGPNGAFSKSEVKWQGKILDQYIISSSETDNSKKSYDIVIKGHPFDPSRFTGDIVYSSPFNFGPVNNLATKGKIATQWSEDWSSITDKLRVYYDFTATRKYNSNNFVIERAAKDAVTNDTYIKTYAYSSCN